MPHLLVVGANGVLGNMAARLFLDKGYRVTAFVRDAGRAGELRNKGALIKVGDLTNADSLNGLCNEVDIVLTAAHSLLGNRKNSSQQVDELGHRLLIDEAVKSGVKHFIFTSVANVSANHPIDFFRTKFKIEQHLAKSGVNYSILRMPAFMEWHAYNLLGKKIIEKGKATIFGKGIKPVNFIAVKDVVATVNKIAGVEKYFGEIVLVAGPENISRNRVASLFFKAANRKERITHVPIAVVKVFAVLFSLFHPGIARIMKLTAYSEKADETLDTAQSIAQFGLQPTGINEFIEQVVNKKA